MVVSFLVCDFGVKVLEFILLDLDGCMFGLCDIVGVCGMLVMFICNYCFYVQVVIDCISCDVDQLCVYGIGLVVILLNDVVYYLQDVFDLMKFEVQKYGFIFFYFFDEIQVVVCQFGV